MTTPSTELSVEAHGLVKRFPRQAGWRTLFKKAEETLALDGIDLEIHRGETYGILGPNGAGKTTLIKILCTLITPNEGTARIAGFDVVRDEKQVRRRIGLIYGDQRSFYWRLSLRENLRFYGLLYGLPGNRIKARTDDLLEMVGLEHAAELRMHSFSSGMKQRAAIARGLIADPEIVFLDEPTTSVDPIHSYEIRNMIKQRVANDGRRTVILTTNTMEEAEVLCDRMALIAHGRILHSGDVTDLREKFQPDEMYTLQVSELAEFSLRRLQSLEGMVQIEINEADNGIHTLRVEIERGVPVIPEAIKLLVVDGARVWSCSKDELSLDEMFRLAFDDRQRMAAMNTTTLPVATAGSIRS